MSLVGRVAEGEVYILRSPGIAASPISFLFMGRVCRRSLTAEEILFTGKQTCFLYLVLWLCGKVLLRQWLTREAGWLHMISCLRFLMNRKNYTGK